MSALLHYEGDINVRVAPAEPYDVGITPPRTPTELARIMNNANIKQLGAVLTATLDTERDMTVIHIEPQPHRVMPLPMRTLSAIGCALSEPFQLQLDPK